MTYKDFLDLMLFAGLVYVPLAVGAAVRHLHLFRQDISRPVMTGCWLFLEPIAITLAFWSLNLQQAGDLIAAPVMGGLWMLSMAGVAALISKRMQLNQLQRGNILLASMFSNNGITLGAFLCLILIRSPGNPQAGIEGQALGLLFILFFLPLLLTVGFGIGRRSHRKWASEEETESPRTPRMMAIRIVPYCAMALGFSLNLAGFRPPGFALPLNRGVVYADVAIYSFAIGTLFTLGSVRKYLKKCIVISALKFLVGPVLGLALFLLAGLVLDLSPMMLQVIVVQCTMPVAIMSVVVSRFFHLDTELSAALWVFSTLAVAAIVPVLAAIVPRLG